MEPRILLAFAGKMYTGKDTSADIWVNKYKQYAESVRALQCTNMTQPLIRGYKRLAFADGIKSICKQLFDLTEQDVNTPDGKKKLIPLYDKTVRELLQGVGEGLRQSISQNIWVYNTMQLIDKILQFDQANILVTDVRYINELNALKARGFTMIKLVRNTGVIDNHPSEKELSDRLFDCVIDNNGSIADLEAKLLELPAYHPTR